MKIHAPIKTVVLLCTLLFSLQTFAAETMSPPQATVAKVSSELRAALRKNQAAIKANPKPALSKIVKEVVIPYIDVNYMANVVLGRIGHMDWKKSTKVKQDEFISQFITLIVGTYSAALQEYDNQPVKVFPVRGYTSAASTAEVHSILVKDNGQKIAMLYRLIKEDDTWKITDFSVEGISLVQSYQAQFQSIVQSKGVDGLINTLKKHNESNK